MENYPIDFVVTWVDGSDEDWINEKKLYQSFSDRNNGEERYRDWGLLRYWFRGIEKYAPWVNNIFFITWGHLPSWIDVTNPKLKIVNHSDFIPSKYLPTFNSNTIELNIHRIEGLSEHFVLFNDDMFLIGQTTRDSFFYKGRPRAVAVHVPCRVGKHERYYTQINNVSVINDHFKQRESVMKHFGKWFNPSYGVQLFSTLCMLPFPAFYGFLQLHLATSYTKSTFYEVWNEEEALLDSVCMHKFREADDLSHWLMESWQIVTGNFAPRSVHFGKSFIANPSNLEGFYKGIPSYLAAKKGKMICINDSALDSQDLNNVSRFVAQNFQNIFPEKSSFEI